MRASMRTAGRDWALIDVGVAATELSSPYPCRDIVALFMTGIHPRYATLMSTGSTYEETLPCGGRLRIFRDNWEIRYFFSGRDLRYKSTFKTIPGEEVEQYIQAYQKNWIDFIALKGSNPKGQQCCQICGRRHDDQHWCVRRCFPGCVSHANQLRRSVGVYGWRIPVCANARRSDTSVLEDLIITRMKILLSLCLILTSSIAAGEPLGTPCGKFPFDYDVSPPQTVKQIERQEWLRFPIGASSWAICLRCPPVPDMPSGPPSKRQ